MRLLLLLFVCLACAPLALADGQPSAGVVAACQAEATQLGKDAFLVKYGPTEPYGHCYAAKTAATPPVTTAPAPADDPAAAACKAEYLKLGSAAFVAKYGPDEAYGHCLAKAKSGTTPPPAPPVKTTTTTTTTTSTTTTTTTPSTTSTDPAVAACKAEYLKIGGTAFLAKYGAKETLGNCVAAAHSPEKTAQAACLAEAKSGGTAAFAAKYGPKESFGNCVKLAAKKNRR